MKKQLVFVYTRINGIEKRMVNTNLMPKAKVGLIENKEFHEVFTINKTYDTTAELIRLEFRPLKPTALIKKMSPLVKTQISRIDDIEGYFAKLRGGEE